MPAIELFGTAEDIGWCRAVMLFPKSQAVRDQHFTVHCAGALVDKRSDDEMVEMSVRDLSALIHAPSLTELKRLATESTKAGIIAGDMLNALYAMHYFKMEEPSLNKAEAFISAFAKASTYGDGSKIDHSHDRIKQAWREYMPVAHLWGAFRMNKSYPYVAKGEEFGSGFSVFLQIAQELYAFGSGFMPMRAKPNVPILDPKKCWVLPSSISPAPLKAEKPPAKLTKFVRAYKAK
jgi:hypothetical protein